MQQEKYDKQYNFGNTKVYIISPKISKEEAQKRWQDVCDITSTIIKQLIYKGGEINAG